MLTQLTRGMAVNSPHQGQLRGSMDFVKITIRRLSAPEFSMLCPQLVDIYERAMGYSQEDTARRISTWRSDSRYRGFNAVIALSGDIILGVAYGHLGETSRWWHREVATGLRSSGEKPEDYENILRDYFEISEVHVEPAAQGRGIGRALITDLLHLAPASYALLSTPEVEAEDNLAFGLYRSLGFQDVLRNYCFYGDLRPFAILGRALPLELSSQQN